MKKIFITLLLLISSIGIASKAEVIIDYSGPTLITNTMVERNLQIKSSDNGVYDIVLRPLDDALTSIDGNIRIPLSNVYISNYDEDIYLRYNEPSYLFRRLEMSNLTRNIVAKINNYGMVPAGTYNLNFEVLAINPDTQVTSSVTTFNMQFNVPVLHQLSFEAKRPEIKVSINDVFDTNKEFKSEISPMVYINSNTDWILLARNDAIEEKAGDYYIRTVAASDTVTERLQERTRLEEGKEIVVAKGKAPSSNAYVAIEYSVESADNKKLRPGEYKNNIKFILRENGRI